MRVAVVGDRRTADRDCGLGLVNDDRDRAVGVVVVAGGVGEGPVGRSAGNVHEARAQVQPTQDEAANTGGRSAGAMGVAVIGDRRAADVDSGVGLVDLDLHRASGMVIVAGDVRKDPAGRSAGDVGEAVAQVETGKRLIVDADGRATSPVSVAVVGDRGAVDYERGVRLIDDNRGGG